MLAAAVACAAACGPRSRHRFLWSIVAGLCLGPGFLGTAAPDAFRAVMRGGAHETQQLADAHRAYEADRAALEATGVTPIALTELDQFAADRFRQLRDAQRHAEQLHQAPLQLIVHWLLMPAVLFEAMRRARPDVTLTGGLVVMVPALLGIILPGTVAVGVGYGLLMAGWFDPPPVDAGLWLTGLAIGCAAVSVPLFSARPDSDAETHSLARAQLLIVWAALAAVLTALQAHAADQPFDLMQLVMHAMMFAATGMMATMTPILTHPRGRWMDGLCVALGVGLVAAGAMVSHAAAMIGAIVAGMVAARLTRPRLIHPADDDSHMRPTWVLESLLVIYIVSRTDLIAGLDWLLLLGVLIAFGDAKLLGVMIGRRFTNEPGWAEPMRSGTLVVGGGPLCLAAAYLLYDRRALDDRAMASLVLSALCCAALMRPMLRWIGELFVRPAAATSPEPPRYD